MLKVAKIMNSTSKLMYILHSEIDLVFSSIETILKVAKIKTSVMFCFVLNFRFLCILTAQKMPMTTFYTSA